MKIHLVGAEFSMRMDGQKWQS